MSNINCNVVKDLMTLYVEDLSTDETNLLIENHLETCEECRIYLKNMKENINVELEIDNENLENEGENIIKTIKKSQDRIKYTFIIFAMFVGVGNGWLSDGFMSTIPLIIIIPYVLNLIYSEGKIIMLTSVCANIVLAIATENIDLGLISTPFVILAIIVSILMARLTKSIMKEGK